MTSIPESSLGDQVGSQAELIVNTLQQTDYQYAALFDAQNGIYDCDCSAFVSFVLDSFFPDHYAPVPKDPGHVWPRAFLYYQFLHGLPAESNAGWVQVAALRDVRRGDVIAWQLPLEAGHDTGHVFFAAETPKADESGIFVLRVYDSANRAHFDDTRSSGPFSSGVGSGFINFEVDDAGSPTAFQFAPGEEFVPIPIAIGRLSPIS